MLLKSVKYHNFRSFYGDQMIQFTMPQDDSESNVTVVLGDNTYGKSTIVLSFVWCLYGESRFSRPNDILNKKVELRMRPYQHEEAYVEVAFEDGGKEYTMRRTQKFTMDSNGIIKADQTMPRLSYVTENGETKLVGTTTLGIKQAIDDILPQDLASFFFFEGEKNNEIEKKDLGDAVRTLLGLKAFGNMRMHLMGSETATSPTKASVMGYYNEKQNDESDSKAKAEYNKMLAAQAALKEITERIAELRKNIEFYDKRIKEINEALRQAAPFKELQKRRDQIQDELKQNEQELKQLYKNLIELFNGKDSLALFLYPFIGRASTKLNEMDAADKGIKGIEAPAIEELLKRGVCLCGTDLMPGSLPYKNVKKYIDYIPPKSVGTIVRDMLEKLDETGDTAARFVKSFEECYQRIQRCRVRINKLEQEASEKLAEIAKIGNVDTSDAESNLLDYTRKLKELRNELERKLSEEGRRKSEIDTAERNFNMYKSKSNKAREYLLYYKYAEAIYQWVNEHYSLKENQMRERLNQNVTDLFNSMYAGKREIKIDEKYNVRLTVNGEVVDITGGLRVIQYFAYVGGLVKLAYEVMQERENGSDDEAAFGEQYPLVLDAAFSHADQTHTRNIAKALASATTQLIFALMPKDWQYAKEGLIGKVGRMYELTKIDETETRIQEVH